MAVPLFLFEILYMLCLSIFSGLFCLAFMYFLIHYVPVIVRFTSPPLARLSSALPTISVFPSYNLTMRPMGPRPSEIYRTASILAHVLPADLVPVVLDMAEFWVDLPLASTNHEFHATERNAGSPYLVAEIPLNLRPNCLRSLTFTVTSRDQGYSSDAQFHNTYQNSWTWFEVAVLPPDSEKSFDRDLVPGTRVVTNLNACREYKTHDVTWTYYDDDDDIRKIMRSLRPGHKIAITAWARYPAWLNYVRGARIDCQVNAVRKM